MRYGMGVGGFILGMVACAGLQQHYQWFAGAIRPLDGVSFSDGAVYYGALNAQGRPEGKGYLRWPNGRYYEGEFKDGLMHGQGRNVAANGAVFEGEFKQGMASGQQKVVFANGAVYEGRMSQDMFSGEGSFRYRSGEVYQGQFEMDDFSGYGQLTGQGEYQYSGQFKYGVYHGEGAILYENGDKYRGSFANGKLNGQGVYTSEDGTVYRGEFVDGQFTGQGAIFYSETGNYVGDVLNWLPHGEGKRLNGQGALYSGTFEQGVLQGEGSYIDVDGLRYQGQFDQGEFSGQGRLQYANGDVYQGEFSDGYRWGEGTLTYKEPQDGIEQISGTWEYDERIQDDQGNALPSQYSASNATEIAEFALYHQTDLLQQALQQVVAGDPKQVELYSLIVGGYGSQGVFHREVQFIETYFAPQYQQPGHGIYLSNSAKSWQERPMATYTSLQQSLQTLAAQMNPEQDILFLYITSHGSRDKQISLQQEGIRLADLSSQQLKQLLAEQPFQWKVIILSACYSGGFIEDLQDEQTLIMTAAAADRTSFGCSDENDFTYFGRALFKEALPVTDSFVAAFDQAKQLIQQWESDEDLTPSNPQIHRPEAIVRYLQQWRQSRAALYASYPSSLSTDADEVVVAEDQAH